MNSLAVLIDFGSTFTKVAVVDLADARLVGRSQAPSTVLTDVREGLLEALASLHRRHGLFEGVPEDLSVLEGGLVLASSSAAGGLRVAVVGNVPGLTVEAAEQAALGAGAKIVAATAFKLSEAALGEIARARPDMILLTGGADGGDAATILHNARALARSELTVPIIVAGNRAVAFEVCRILERSGKEVRSADNVMPKSGTLSVEAAREKIRALFMERITKAKGLEALGDLVPVVLPTPMAVLEAARLGAEGTGSAKGWGDLVVVDVGGATTDVHSIGHGTPSGPQIVERGLPEPYAKRTVEGDLGIRFNAPTLLARAGAEQFAGEFRAGFPDLEVSPAEIGRYVEELGRETARLPAETWQGAVDAQLARLAVDLALERHAGRRERIVAREGEAWAYYGKDLSENRTVIGTGGVFIYNPRAPYIFSQGVSGSRHYEVLRPKNPAFFVDASYVLYAVGLLSRERPETALRLFKEQLRPAVRAPA